MAAECHRHWSGSLLGMFGGILGQPWQAGLSLAGQVAVGEWAAVVMLLMLAKLVGAAAVPQCEQAWD